MFCPRARSFRFRQVPDGLGLFGFRLQDLNLLRAQGISMFCSVLGLLTFALNLFLVFSCDMCFSDASTGGWYRVLAYSVLVEVPGPGLNRYAWNHRSPELALSRCKTLPKALLTHHGRALWKLRQHAAADRCWRGFRTHGRRGSRRWAHFGSLLTNPKQGNGVFFCLLLLRVLLLFPGGNPKP